MDNSNSFDPFQDASNNIPYYDPFLLNDQNPSLGLPELLPITEPSIESWLDPGMSGVGDNTLISDELVSDEFLSDMIVDHSGDVVENFEGGVSGVNGESVIGQENVNNGQNFAESLGFGNPVQIPDWPSLQSPQDCSSCQLLREIIHTNGKQMRKLHIHGPVENFGLLSHAVLDTFDPDNSSGSHEYHMIDFCSESTDNVKSFLVQYCQDRIREGYQMLPDPFSNFYQALCVGLDIASDSVPQSSMVSGQDAESNVVGHNKSDSTHTALSQQTAERNGAGPSRSNLAAQRARTVNMTVKDFTDCFDLPIDEAAKKMNVCRSVIKKKCRAAGLSRWPHRKIKGIKRKISEKRKSLAASTDEGRPQIVAEIQALEKQLADFFAKLNCS